MSSLHLFLSFSLLFFFSSSILCFDIPITTPSPTSSPPFDDDDDTQGPFIPVKIFHGGPEGLARLGKLDINFDHHCTKQEISAFVTQEQMEELKKQNFTVKTNWEEVRKLKERAKEFFSRAEKSKRSSFPITLSTECSVIPPSEMDFTREFHDYHNTASLTAFMRKVNCLFPSITHLFSIGKSAEGRELLVMEISKNPGVDEAEPKFKYIANMHGDEVIGRENILRFILYLCQKYQAQDPRFVSLIDSTDIYLMPSMNPDGFEHMRRYNSRFVDLNRNFPDQFRVSRARIEPETKNVMDWSKSKPFVLSANFHGGSVVANYPWDGNANQRSGVYSGAPDDSTFVQLALTYSRNHRKMSRSQEFPNGIVNGAAWYVLYGGMQDWNYIETGDLEITIELSDDKWPPKEQLEEFWLDNQEAMVRYLEAVHTGFKGKIVDAETKQPLAATIIVTSIPHVVKTNPLHGDYYRLIVPGTYEVTASASGKKSVTKQVVVTPGLAVVLDFEL